MGETANQNKSTGVKNMQAFHNDPAIKEKYLLRVRAHALADEITQGIYYEEKNGKFRVCAVGCTIHGNSHKAYEDELGIPQLLARLEDGIFEGLPLEHAKLWPEQFLAVIKVGADLSGVWPKFATWLLADPIHGIIKFAKTDEQKEIIQKIADAYRDYKNIPLNEWQELRDAAATAHADDAAAYAAAASAVYAYAAYAAARQKARIIQADKLLELLKEIGIEI